jgi:hypothetical protein
MMDLQNFLSDACIEVAGQYPGAKVIGIGTMMLSNHGSGDVDNPCKPFWQLILICVNAICLGQTPDDHNGPSDDDEEELYSYPSRGDIIAQWGETEGDYDDH